MKTKNTKPGEMLDQMLDAYDRTSRAETHLNKGRKSTALTLASSAVAAASALQASAVPVYVNMTVNLTQTFTGPGAMATTSQVDLNMDGMVDITLGLYGLHGAFGFGLATLQGSARINPAGSNIVELGAAPDQVNPFMNGSLIGVGASVTSGSALFLSNSAAFNTTNSTAIVPPPIFLTSTGLWNGSVTRFAGVRFVDNLALPHWAWLRFHIGTDSNGLVNAITLQDWAYESTPSTPITAGVTNIPEPSTAALFGLGLIALGARGVRRFREERKES